MVIADETILLGLGDYTPLYTVYFLYRRIDLLWIHQCERHIMNDQINAAHNTNTITNPTYNMMVYHQSCNKFLQNLEISVHGNGAQNDNYH